MTQPRLVAAIAALAIATALTACTVTFLPGDDATTVDRPRPPVVTPPAPTPPDRPRPQPAPELPSDAGFRLFEIGADPIYPGTQLWFRVAVRDAGYVTISALAPDGRVTVLVRDEPVPAGSRPTIVPPIGSRNPPLASAPVGAWRVRAQWAPRPTNARYDGVRGLDAWTDAIAANLARIEGASVFDDRFEVLAR